MPTFALALLAALLLAPGLARAQEAAFSGLGYLPGGGIVSSAYGVSADRSVVVGYSDSANGEEAFRWTAATGMVGLGDLPGGSFLSVAHGVSADGSVVVGYSRSANGDEPFRWTAATGMVGLGGFPGGFFASIATGVSADGSIVVGYSNSANGFEAFRWTAATGMVGLGDLPGGDFQSIATGVSADGSVVVGRSKSANGEEAFRWTAATGMVGLGGLPGSSFRSVATGVSADGSVVVGFSGGLSANEAFRWTATGGMQSLGPPGPVESFARGVSADGTVVVGSSGDNEAVIWTPDEGKRNLRSVLVGLGVNLDGWALHQALGVSADGTIIVGTGMNPAGQVEAFRSVLGASLALLTPTPGALLVGGEPFRIRWRASAATNFVELTLLPDTLGAAPVTIDFALPAADTAYVWAVPDTLFSRSARVVVSDSFDPTVADTSAVFRVRPLHLTRLLPDGRYEPFNPQRHGWAFGNDPDPLFPATWFAQPRFQYGGGLDPVTGDEYSIRFRFVTNATPQTFVDWPSWVGAFGQDATYSLGGSFYRLTALQRWTRVTRPPWRGSCFGMSIMSLMAFSDPARFGAAFPTIGAIGEVFALGADLDARPDIREAVNNRFAHQYGRAHQQRLAQARNQTPRETLAELKTLFADDAYPGLGALAVFAAQGGHSVLAYGLSRVGTPGRYRIQIYDPNHPGGFTGTPIVIDSTANLWTFADLGWSAGDGLYLEDPIGNYYDTAIHPAFGEAPGGARGADASGGGALAVHVTPGARTTLTDPAGRRIGYADGLTFNEVPGAYPDVPLVGGPTPPVGYYVPEGARYHLTLADAPAGTVRAVFDTGGQSLSFARQDAAPGQTDAFTFEPDGLLRVQNPDPSPRTVVLMALEVGADEERMLALDGLTLAGPDSLRLRLESGAVLRVENPGAAKTYALRLFGEDDATFAAPALAAGATHRLRPDWATLTTVALDVDADGDGTFEQTITLANTVAGEDGPETPTALALTASPNPAAGSVRLGVSLPEAGAVRVTVHDALGRTVAVVADGPLAAGSHALAVDTRGWAAGVYVVRLDTPRGNRTTLLTVAR